MHVLLIEDDSLLGKETRIGLEQQGYAVDWVPNGAAAETAMAAKDYAVLVLDIGLPKQDGTVLLKKLRTKGRLVPVIVIMARDDVAEKISGLDGDADDFIVKPFGVQELSARLRAVVRRVTSRVCDDLLHGPLKVNSAARTVTLDDKSITLTAREFAILAHLLEHRGKVLSKQQLQESLYRWADEVESNTVEVHIHHLRRKLGRDLIKTMHGVGYLIDQSVRTD